MKLASTIRQLCLWSERPRAGMYACVNVYICIRFRQCASVRMLCSGFCLCLRPSFLGYVQRVISKVVGYQRIKRARSAGEDSSIYIYAPYMIIYGLCMITYGAYVCMYV